MSTPGTYTLTASLAGFGTEVIQVPLAEGAAADGRHDLDDARRRLDHRSHVGRRRTRSVASR